MNIAYSVFVSLVWFLSTYFNVVILLLFFKNKGSFYNSPSIDKSEKLPIVSIIVPAFNEEKTIAESIYSLKKIDYPKDLLEIIVVNDGSSDGTSEVIRRNIGESFITFIDNKTNKGKAACLNQGIKASKGEFVATMDSDSEVSEDIIRKTIPYFKDKKIGSVSVTVKVKNPKSFLQKIIEIEYIIGLSVMLKILSYIDGMHVTPGPFSIYRKSMLKKIGMFDASSITEDLEIAYRIQKNRYKMAFCTTTYVKTIIPDNFRALHRQRKRWYSGALLTLWKHKIMLFKRKGGIFGFIIPYTNILVTLGLLLFFFTVYLSISNFIKSIPFYVLTHFDVLSYLNFNFDFLSLGVLAVLGLMAILTTIIVAYIGLNFVKKTSTYTIPGFVGFIFLFFLYQIFWTSSFYAVLFRRNLKWR